MLRALQAIALLLILIPAAAQAQNPQTRQGFGISFGIGSGSAGSTCDFCNSDRESGLSGYLRIGGHVRPNLLIAGETNGWTRSSDGIDQTIGFYSAVAQWYPNVESGFFLKGGAGLARYVATDGIDDVTGNALGLTLGAGYDIRVATIFSLTPYANYLISSKGEIKLNDTSTGLNVSTNVLQFGLGFTWH